MVVFSIVTFMFLVACLKNKKIKFSEKISLVLRRSFFLYIIIILPGLLGAWNAPLFFTLYTKHGSTNIWGELKCILLCTSLFTLPYSTLPYIHCNINKKKVWWTSCAGFEPTRAKPKRFQVVLLNHSDITAIKSILFIYV